MAVRRQPFGQDEYAPEEGGVYQPPGLDYSGFGGDSTPEDPSQMAHPGGPTGGFNEGLQPDVPAGYDKQAAFNATQPPPVVAADPGWLNTSASTPAPEVAPTPGSATPSAIGGPVSGPDAPDPFASLGGGTFIPGVGWVPTMNAAAYGRTPSAPSPVSSGGSASSSTPTANLSVEQLLRQVLGSGGRYDTNLIDARIGNVRENLESMRRSEMDTRKAQLADQGIYDSGPINTAMDDLSENISSLFGQQVNDIVSNEQQAADRRFMDALGLLTGMDQANLDRAVSWFNAQTGRDVGMGGVANAAEGNRITEALGRLQDETRRREQDISAANAGAGRSSAEMMQERELALREAGMRQDDAHFLAQLDLARDQQSFNQAHQPTDDLLSLLQLWASGVGAANGGFR